MKRPAIRRAVLILVLITATLLGVAKGCRPQRHGATVAEHLAMITNLPASKFVDPRSFRIVTFLRGSAPICKFELSQEDIVVLLETCGFREQNYRPIPMFDGLAPRWWLMPQESSSAGKYYETDTSLSLWIHHSTRECFLYNSRGS